jgi:hypothetical protein
VKLLAEEREFVELIWKKSQELRNWSREESSLAVALLSSTLSVCLVSLSLLLGRSRLILPVNWFYSSQVIPCLCWFCFWMLSRPNDGCSVLDIPGMQTASIFEMCQADVSEVHAASTFDDAEKRGWMYVNVGTAPAFTQCRPNSRFNISFAFIFVWVWNLVCLRDVRFVDIRVSVLWW